MFVLTTDSAVNVARFYVKQKAEHPGTGSLVRMGLSAALSNGIIEDIFTEMESMGFRICADEGCDTVRAYVKAGSIAKDESVRL